MKIRLSFKPFLTALVLVASAPVALADDCDGTVALSKAREVSDLLAKLNDVKALQVRTDSPIVEDEHSYLVVTSYDTGLTVPTFNVKVSKHGCRIVEVQTTDREG